MDACHLLVGMPWQYDRVVTHNSQKNSYSFMWHNTGIMPMAQKEVVLKPPIEKGTNLLIRGVFVEEMEDIQFGYVLVAKENRGDESVLDAIRPLLDEFFEVSSQRTYLMVFHPYGIFNTRLI